MLLSMQFCGRAFYNLLLMNPEQRTLYPTKPWQVEDYRLLETAELFQRLQELEGPAEEDLFRTYECDSPEELVTAWFPTQNQETVEQAFLLIFELWRRLLPDRESLSIFCDRLDHTLLLYDRGELPADLLLKTLSDLDSVLESNADQSSPKEAMASLATYLAHDLERFLYEVIQQQIDEHNDLFAQELIDDFYPFLTKPEWFRFLRLQLSNLVDEEENRLMTAHLIDLLEECPQKELLFKLLAFLIQRGTAEEFKRVFLLLVQVLENTVDLQALARLTARYFSAIADTASTKKLQQLSTTTLDRNTLDTLRQITLEGIKI